MNPEYDYRFGLGGNRKSLINGSLLIPDLVRHRIFVSYHHAGDQQYYDWFSQTFHDAYEAISDRSLERPVDSENQLYVMQRIRDTCLTGTSCTIVLVGANTHQRKYVDWEIYATLDKKHALIGVQLPTAPLDVQGRVIVPDRLQDNIASGFAMWVTWAQLTANAQALQSLVAQAKLKGTGLIDNSRARMTRNRL